MAPLRLAKTPEDGNRTLSFVHDRTIDGTTLAWEGSSPVVISPAPCLSMLPQDGLIEPIKLSI